MMKNDKTLIGIIITHVDDFIHCGDCIFEETVMKPLLQRFLAGRVASGKFKYIGLNILQTEKHEIYLDQNEYSSSIEEPVITGNKNDKVDLSAEEYTTFRALVGAMNWLVCGSRPDLAYDLLEHSTKFKKATKSDLSQCIRSVRKCKKETVVNKFSCLELGLPMKLILFSDASFANLPDSVSSSLGYVIFMADCNGKCSTISWRSNKIRRICRSTLAAESMALIEGLEESLYIQSVLDELGFLHTITAIVDSKSLHDAIHSTKLVDDKRLRIDIASIQELVQQKKAIIKWSPAEKQLANALTKRGASPAHLLEVLRLGSIKAYLD